MRCSALVSSQSEAKVRVTVADRSTGLAQVPQFLILYDVVLTPSIGTRFIFVHAVGAERHRLRTNRRGLINQNAHTLIATKTHAMETKASVIVCPRMYFGA